MKFLKPGWGILALFVVFCAAEVTAQSSDRCAAPADDEAKTYMIDVTPGFPPFDNVDDPRPPDENHIEANIFVQGDDISHGTHTIDGPAVDLNLGKCFRYIGHVQFMWEGWFTTQSDRDDGTTKSGVGNNSAGIKWLILDSETSGLGGILRGVSIGIFPQVQFAPDHDAVNHGLAQGGQVYTLPLLISKNFEINERPFAVSFNAGYEHGTGGNPDGRFSSIGFSTAVAPRTAMMISAAKTNFNNGDPSQEKYELGVVHMPLRFKNLKFFGMVGTQKDDSSHVIWALGFQDDIDLN